jgi:integrase/recombinase XerD
MGRHRTRAIDPTKILSSDEIGQVLANLRKRIADNGSISTTTNLTIFRLATGCGLRASEIAGLLVNDVHAENSKPYIQVRAGTAKRHKARRVALWWDAGTLDDVRLWKQFRVEEQEAGPDAPFVCQVCVWRGGFAEKVVGNALSRKAVRDRFIAACRVLGAERQRSITTHTGRHSFASHALAAGRTLPEVQQALGHANIALTSIYLHVAVDDDGEVGQIFEKEKKAKPLTEKQIVAKAIEYVKELQDGRCE